MKRTMMAYGRAFLLAFLLWGNSYFLAATPHGDTLRPGNPDATREAVELFRYLYGLSNSDSDTGKLISGQWFGASFAPGKGSYPFQLGELVEIRKQTGKWLGLIDAWICPGSFGDFPGNDPVDDCMWYGDLLADYQLIWNNGGILHIDASFFAPLADRYAGRLDEGIIVNADSLLTSGTGSNQRWRAICDRMAEFFLALQEKDVPVIFRPFTEAYIRGYWYSYRNGKLGPENFKRLYIDTWHYLTEEKDCHNILWDFQGSNTEAAYPGRKYVDVITGYSDYLAWGGNNQMKCNQNQPLPYGNAELGDYGRSQRTLDAGKVEIPWNVWGEWARKNCPRLSFYTTWDRDWGPVKKETFPGLYGNYDTGYNELIANPYIVTRDEIRFPSLPEPPQLPFHDGFSEENSSWVNSRGTWVVDDGTYACTSPDYESRALYGHLDWSDYQVQASLQAASLSGKSAAGITGRCASSRIGYSLTFNEWGLTLRRHFNDYTSVMGFWAHGFKTETEYTLKLEFKGDTIKGYVDTGEGLTERISAVDSHIPFGCAGLFTGHTSASFDDFKVEENALTALLTPDIPAGSSYLGQNYPNPFTKSTILELNILEQADIQIDIYDSYGRLIKNLLDQCLETGTYTFSWDGTLGNGLRVTPGLYLCHMEAVLNGFTYSEVVKIMRQ